MKITFEKILRWFIICGIFVIPLIALLFIPSMYQPYQAPKGFMFRIIVELITGAWIMLAITHNKYRPRRSWILGTLALFVFIMAIADAWGVNPYLSFLSHYNRMDGWITLIHFFAYTVVASSIISTDKLWKMLLRGSLVTSGIVAIYGLLQLAGVSTFVLDGQSGFSARIDATMGNPSYLAVYMLFHVFIALLLWVEARNEFPNKMHTTSLVYGGVLTLDTLILFLTGTRGAIFGLLCGGIFTLIIFALLSKSQKVRWITGIIIFLTILLGGSLRFIQGMPFVQNVSVLNRLATISLNDSSIQSRLFLYNTAWQGLKERPVFGWGQENYTAVFFKYLEPRLDDGVIRSDRAHNIIFDQLVAGGLLGFIAYILIFATTLLVMWRKSRFSNAEKCILTGLLAGYIVQNLVFFDSVISYMLFGTILAYIVHKEKDSGVIFEKFKVPKSLFLYLAIFISLISLEVVWWVNAPAIFANQTLMRAVDMQQISQEKDLLNNLEYFKKAIAFNSFGTPEVRAELLNFTQLVLGNKNISRDIKEKFFDYNKEQMELLVKEAPYDERAVIVLSEIYMAYGDNVHAQQTLRNALEWLPGNQRILSRTETFFVPR
jgi:O-antigen ligase